MKVLLYVILIFMLVTTCFAGNFFGNAEFGFIMEGEGCFAALELGYIHSLSSMAKTSIWAGVETLMDQGTGLSFQPYEAIYSIGGCLFIDVFFFEIKHSCKHWNWSSQEQWEKRVLPNIDYHIGRSRTKVSVGIKFP